MTEFITRNYGNENFEIIIKTDSKEHYKATENFARGLIDHTKPAPTIETKPVVHAHWTGSDGMDCSHCERSYMDVADADSYESGDIPDFCPYCGAQMDEEADDG